MSAEHTPTTSEPGRVQRAARFGRAVVRHVVGGARKVDEETYERRLAICGTCKHCNVENMICQHANCGCRLRIKAAWKSETCPVGAWPGDRANESESPPN